LGSELLLLAESSPVPSVWTRGALLTLALAIVITTVALMAHVWRTRRRPSRRRPTTAPPPLPQAIGALARRLRHGAGASGGGSSLGTEATAETSPRVRSIPRRRKITLTGVLAKHCPRCGARYDLALSHCDKDGVELRTLN